MLDFGADLNNTDKFGKSVCSRAKTKEIASLIASEAKSTERSLATKYGTPRGNNKDLLGINTKLCDNEVKVRINSYLKSAKTNSENLLSNQLKKKLKIHLEKSNREITSFMLSNLIQGAQKASGVGLFNLKKKAISKGTLKQNATQDVKLSNGVPKRSFSTRNNLRDSRETEGSMLSQNEVTSIPEDTIANYIKKLVKTMQEELLRVLSEKLSTDVENAMSKIKLDIEITNHNQFKELAQKVKNKLTNSLNKKLILSSKLTQKQYEAQQSGLKDDLTSSRNNSISFKQSTCNENVKSFEEKKSLKIIPPYNGTLKSRQKLLSEEPKSLISSGDFLAGKMEKGLYITKELTEYSAY